MQPTIWDWPLVQDQEKHHARTALLREVYWTATQVVETVDQPRLGGGGDLGKGERALTLDMSAGGMLLLTAGRPQPEQVLRVQIPRVGNGTAITRLAEVRWIRRVPFPQHQALYFVGVQFLS